MARELHAKPRKRLVRILVPAGVLLVAAAGLIAAGVATGWFAGFGNGPWGPELTPDPQAVDGTPGVADADTPVEEGQYRMVVNQIPTMQAGDTTCPIELANVPGNHYAVRATIVDNQDAALYRSGRIDPGRSIAAVELNRALEPGEHAARVIFELFDPTDGTPQGETAAAITIRVQK